MKEYNLILIKSKQFALRIIKLYKYLCEQKKEYILSNRLFAAAPVSVPMRKKLA